MYSVKRKQYAYALALSLIVGCGSSSGGGSDDDNTVTVEVTTVVQGQVTDSDGTPLADVFVSGAGGHAVTNDDGNYSIAATPGRGEVITFSGDGFLSSFKAVDVFQDEVSALDAQLLAEEAAQPLDSDTGGTVSTDPGGILSAPANAFVDATGAAVTGAVDVHLTVVDVTDQSQVDSIAVDFRATTESGAPALLESFGMMDITVRQEGQDLDVADGAALEITIPVPDGAVDPPATIPLWSVDEQSGTWVQEGTATLNGEGTAYVGSIEHMSPWNCDQVAEATCITGLVLDAETGEPIVGGRVTAYGVDYYGTSSGTTDEDGNFWLAVRKSSEVAVLAFHLSGGGQERIVMSGTEDTTVPPTPGDPRCLDVGQWDVERDVVRLQDGTVISCSDVLGANNPFTGTCADGLEDTFTCFEATGACTTSFADDQSITTTYASGSRMVISGSDGSDTEIQAYGNNGSLCFTQTFDQDAQPPTAEVTGANGQTFTYTMPDEDDDDMVLTCPGGDQIVLTRTDREVMEACGGGSANSDGGQTCTMEGFDIPGSCDSDSDCEGGLVCCDLSDSGGGVAISYCLPAESCPN